MCEVSDKLQLCTCSATDIENARHYWIYHRFVKGQEIEVMGLSIMPYFLDEETDLKNRNLLKNLLNEHSVFDKPIQPQEGDLLSLSFRVDKESQQLTYGFKYTGGRWEEEEYDVFGWMAHHREIKHGKIKKALKKKND